MSGRIGERDLRLPVLVALAAAPGGRLAMRELRRRLRVLLDPRGQDTAPLLNRPDQKFDQIVRNLKSHKRSSTNLVGAGLACEVRGGLAITPAGRAFLAQCST